MNGKKIRFAKTMDSKFAQRMAEALKVIKDPLFYGAMMVRKGVVDSEKDDPRPRKDGRRG